MARGEAGRTFDEVAALHAGLAHPVRVAILRVLQARRRVPLAQLRYAVEALGHRMDGRTLRYHLHRMERAILVDVERRHGRDEAVLVRDVALRVRLVGQS